MIDSKPVPAFTARELRNAFGQFATGVTVVTVRDGDGARGMTANSFTSVSLEPPLLLISVDRRARTHLLLEHADRFAISVLAADHQELSDRYAGRHGELHGKFDDVAHRLTEGGLPLIEGAAASFVCRLAGAYPAGDHTLFLGIVEEMHTNAEAAPLLFFRGQYREL
jgi:flavin reductase (DIM6/NTAB) family NADH-FMN oxidoreductase RutF